MKNTSSEFYEPEVSKLYFPVYLSVDDLQELTNNKLNNVLVDQVQVMDNKKDSIDMKVTRTGDLRFYLEKEQLHASIPLKVDLVIIKKMGASSLKIFEKHPLTFEMDVQLVSEFNLQTDFHLKLKTSVKNISWKREPTVKIAGIDFNIKELVEKKLLEKTPEIIKNVDNSVRNKVNLHQTIDKLWKKVQLGKPLKKGEKDFFVTIQPHTLAVYVDKTMKDSLRLNLELDSKVYIRHAKDTINIGKTPLPKSVTVLNKPSEITTSKVYLHGLFPLYELNELLNRNLKGKLIEKSGVKIKVKSVKLLNARKSIIGEIQITGDLDGKVIIKGYPSFSKETSKISIKSLEIESNLNDPLISVAADMLVNELLSLLNRNVSVYSTDLTDKAPDFARNKIQQSKLAQKADVTLNELHIQAAEVKLTKDNIQLLVTAETNFEITVKKEGLKLKK